jgi:hypothetical protein
VPGPLDGSRAEYRRRRSPVLCEDRLVADSKAIADLLHEAGETHHVVYRIVDGDDPDWASWYADWLLNLSELPQLLGATPVRSHLVRALVQLDRDYTAEPREERWEDWYAERLTGEFGAN